MHSKVNSRKRLDLENKILCLFLQSIYNQFSVFVFICISHYCSTGQPKMAHILSTCIRSPGLEGTRSQSSPWILLFVEHIWRRGRARADPGGDAAAGGNWRRSRWPCTPGDGSHLVLGVTSEGARCPHTLLLAKGNCCCSGTYFPEDQMEILSKRLNLRLQDFE